MSLIIFCGILFFKFSCLFHELSVTGAFSTSVLGWAWPYYSNLQFDAWNLIWCVFGGFFCTCLSFQTETASDLMGVTIFQWLCTEFTNNEEGPLHNGWFQFQLSLLQANYELSWSVLFTRMPTFSSCHDPLVRPPPAPLISPISIYTESGTDRSFQQARAHSTGLCPPPLCFIHHLPLCPYPLSHYPPHPKPMVPLRLSLLVHNTIIAITVYTS